MLRAARGPSFALIYKQFTAGASPYADVGTIILELRFAGLARALESHTLSSVGNRPHVLVVGATVIATWDELLSTTSGATQATMQVFTAA